MIQSNGEADPRINNQSVIDQSLVLMNFSGSRKVKTDPINQTKRHVIPISARFPRTKTIILGRIRTKSSPMMREGVAVGMHRCQVAIATPAQLPVGGRSSPAPLTVTSPPRSSRASPQLGSPFSRTLTDAIFSRSIQRCPVKAGGSGSAPVASSSRSSITFARFNGVCCYSSRTAAAGSSVCPVGAPVMRCDRLSARIDRSGSVKLHFQLLSALIMMKNRGKEKNGDALRISLGLIRVIDLWLRVLCGWLSETNTHSGFVGSFWFRLVHQYCCGGKARDALFEEVEGKKRGAPGFERLTLEQKLRSTDSNLGGRTPAPLWITESVSVTLRGFVHSCAEETQRNMPPSAGANGAPSKTFLSLFLEELLFHRSRTCSTRTLCSGPEGLRLKPMFVVLLWFRTLAAVQPKEDLQLWISSSDPQLNLSPRLSFQELIPVPCCTRLHRREGERRVGSPGAGVSGRHLFKMKAGGSAGFPVQLLPDTPSSSSAPH
ncbi:hypothetical protein DNTS_003504 [Danionella cerebrum]|uniref:Uncharacterized protein n=1 Tax=Danionella cerebrum TaxID=2873325 RepID=A0A553MLI6_9TELE|nr:hypothetical protein DNTS_003504 [Danionella translucida]TRY54030.1 hypothetical protein DNTS_003504 [Danionella translucida]TRY54031.1 hypothetical protein DNTS_003504 [Danionella translucida]TRY54032.1 hypothetical protein DNTS_003504 [Danionella translucida]